MPSHSSGVFCAFTIGTKAWQLVQLLRITSRVAAHCSGVWLPIGLPSHQKTAFMSNSCASAVGAKAAKPPKPAVSTTILLS